MENNPTGKGVINQIIDMSEVKYTKLTMEKLDKIIKDLFDSPHEYKNPIEHMTLQCAQEFDKAMKEEVKQFEYGTLTLDRLNEISKELFDDKMEVKFEYKKEESNEPLIVEIRKDHLVKLYNFAYEQAVITGKVDELKEIDRQINK